MIRIELPPPLDLAASLRPFGRWGDDWIDRWDGSTLVRSIRPNDLQADAPAVPFAARVAGTIDAPQLLVQIPHLSALGTDTVALSIGETFVAVPGSLHELAAEDEHVGRLASRYPGIVPVLVPDPLTGLVRSISAQQINLRWAAVVRRRMAERYGARHEVAGTFVYSLTAEALAAASVEDLRGLQLTLAKSRSVIACARSAAEGRLDASRLAAMDDEELIAELTRLHGIGRWSAEWFLARTLGRPRVVAGDLGVRKAVGRLYGVAGLPSEEAVRTLTAHWGESASVVQGLALHDLAVVQGVA